MPGYNRRPLDTVTHQCEFIINYTEGQGSNSFLPQTDPWIYFSGQAEEAGLGHRPAIMETLSLYTYCLVGYLYPA